MRKSKKKIISFSIIALLIAALIGGRLYLHTWALNYVNKTLNNLESYEGSVKDIDIALYRGAYKIHKLVLNKRGGKIPTPFLDIETTDLSIQWSELLHGRIVSDITLNQPNINFAVTKSAKQTGTEEDWTKAIKDLMPIDINYVRFEDGKLTYQDFDASPKVNLYIHHLRGEAKNLRNVVDKSQPLPSTLHITGESIGGGTFTSDGRMNILKQRPDMDLKTKLENVALPALNNYSRAYAAFDFEAGTLSVYSRLKVQDSKVSGYIKPLAKNIELVNLRKDNPIAVAWETVVSTVITVFTNQRTNQFATKVPLEGNLGNINTDPWSAIVGIIGNAFVSAIKKGFDETGNKDVLPDKEDEE